MVTIMEGGIDLTGNQSFRWKRANLSALTTSQLHLRNPWIPAFFSFSFPGFGNLMQQRLLKGFILISWELFINTKAKINLGIFYSLLGEFNKAKEVLDERWLILYCGIYMYAIWDSYRATVDMNKLYLLADREDAPIAPLNLSSFDFNYLDKREPVTALCWSVIAPGLGHLYIHKVLTGFFIFAFTIFMVHFSHIPVAIHYLVLGNLPKSKAVLDMQWALYIPSIYAYIFYDAYVTAIENNKLFEKALSNYLRHHYQNYRFKFPV